MSIPGRRGQREHFEVVLFDKMAAMYSGLLEKGAVVAVSGHLYQKTHKHEGLGFTDTYFAVDDIQYTDDSISE
jgi:single-stranded DNA-binding protein